MSKLISAAATAYFCLTLGTAGSAFAQTPPVAVTSPTWIYSPPAETECADCPDYAVRFKTFDGDLATKLVSSRSNPAYLVAEGSELSARTFKRTHRVRRRY